MRDKRKGGPRLLKTRATPIFSMSDLVEVFRAMPRKPELQVVDATDLTDAHWAAIDRVKRAYEVAGIDGFCDELERLSKGDVVFEVAIASAFFPAQIRAALMDVMADHGLTMEDLREILEKEKGLPAAS